MKSRIKLKNNYSIDFRPPPTLNSVLGFDSSYLAGNKIHDSQNIVNITNINSLQIHCSLIEGSYINGVSSDLLFIVSPNVPPRYLIQVEPKQKVYVIIKNLSQIDRVRFSIKDKDNNFVDMNMFTFEKLCSLTINMLSQREIRFQKRKLLEEVFYLARIFFFIFIFTHNQLEINHSACRNKDCE